MTPARWRRVGEVFEAATGLDGAARQTFLERECGEDRELADEVASLLAADERAPGFLDAGAVDLVASELDPEPVAEGPSVDGERLGVYRLVREIGRGGMSRVYLAERVGDQLRREVAIKRLSCSGGQREDRLRRFRAEGSVLASLAHPHVAQVFDAGVDPAGDPYLVMEHVDGVAITTWCRERNAPVRKRLELMLDVCAAVDHAHRRLIVHRDLKPSNVLVDREGGVKLLDFGIAKLLGSGEEGGEQESPATRLGMLPMTREYASPEQMVGGAITTATDVYGLGLLLYELLAGRRPFDLEGRTASEIERIVCEQDPPRPSTVVTTPEPAAVDSGERPGRKPSRQLALGTDLDAIVMRALAKEPERRYGSAEALAEDLRRYLEGLPVVARPATVRYRVGKLLRRHRKAVAATAGVILLLATTVIAYTLELRAERDQARRETRRVEEVTALLRDVFWAADPRLDGAGPVTVDELLVRGVERVRRLDTEPLIQAELLHFLALAHFGQGALDEAEPLFRQALDLRRSHLSPPDLQLVDSLNHLGWLHLEEGDHAISAGLFGEALEAHRGWPSAETTELASSLSGLALARNGLGDHEGAEALLRRAIPMFRRVLEPNHPFLGNALQDLGIVLRSQGRHEEAGAAFEESLGIRRTLGPDHPAVADGLHQLALLAEDRGELERARRLFGQAWSIRRNALGADHPATRELAQALEEAQAGGR